MNIFTNRLILVIVNMPMLKEANAPCRPDQGADMVKRHYQGGRVGNLPFYRVIPLHIVLSFFFGCKHKIDI